MSKKYAFLLGVLGTVTVLVSGCRNQNSNDQVVSQRYVHKYGYAVSREEWESKNYPGQVITAMRNGVTVTSTYESGILHGPSTYTFPHSQMVEKYYVYDQGSLVKEIHYDLHGMPVKEIVNHTPSRYTITMWYAGGSPLNVEEYSNSELYEGQYFTANNEIESRVEKGTGLRIRRDQQGVLQSKDTVAGGFLMKRETFYPNGVPESVMNFTSGHLNGEKRTFNQMGEPLAVEEWVNGQLHGKSTYFKNGAKYLEISYLNGAKNGLEIHYLDGEIVSQEILWENDRKHGTSTFYLDGIGQQKYYYDGQEVSQRRFDELNRLDEMISQISAEASPTR